MLVLLNGGLHVEIHFDELTVPLADACVTEWRILTDAPQLAHMQVPLADACVTEWRVGGNVFPIAHSLCHSLMLVLLNGGRSSA